MSLKRILNDEPPPLLPVRHANTGPSRATDHSFPDLSPIPNSAPISPVHTWANRHGQSLHPEQPPPSCGYAYQPVNYQGAGGWDPYSGNYVHGDILPLGRGGNYYPQRERDGISSGPTDPPTSSANAFYKDGDNDHASKRRKGMDDDLDYLPLASKRVRCHDIILGISYSYLLVNSPVLGRTLLVLKLCDLFPHKGTTVRCFRSLAQTRKNVVSYTQTSLIAKKFG